LSNLGSKTSALDDKFKNHWRVNTFGDKMVGDGSHGKDDIGKSIHNAIKHGNFTHKVYALSEETFSSDSAGLSYSSD